MKFKVEGTEREFTIHIEHEGHSRLSVVRDRGEGWSFDRVYGERVVDQYLCGKGVMLYEVIQKAFLRLQIDVMNDDIEAKKS